MKRAVWTVFLFAAAIAIPAADASIEDDRNTLIARRNEDIRRTQNRIQSLQLDSQNAEKKLRETKREVALLEEKMGSRARFMYKLNRRGGAIRYLLTADSIISLLKRAGTLKHLISDELVVMRDKGRTLAELSERLDSNQLEIQQAGEMLKMLEQTLADLRNSNY